MLCWYEYSARVQMRRKQEYTQMFFKYLLTVFVTVGMVMLRLLSMKCDIKLMSIFDNQEFWCGVRGYRNWRDTMSYGRD